jgi:hypothetical protein
MVSLSLDNISIGRAKENTLVMEAQFKKLVVLPKGANVS